MAGKFRNREDDANPIVNLPVRLPMALWERLKADASFNKRSLNSEVVFLCEQGLKGKNETT